MSRHQSTLCITLAFSILGLGLFAAPGANTRASAQPSACDPATAAVHPTPWLQFHRDEMHTGVVTETSGSIPPSRGPVVRWKYKLWDASDPLLPAARTRWASSFPLGDLLGDGKLDVVVTTPNLTTTDYFSNRIIALQDTPNGASPVHVLWTFTNTYGSPAGRGLDTYSPALADMDGDGRLDVIAISSDGRLIVLRGCDGTPLPAWDPPYAMDHSVESGPVIADLFGDGKKEIIVSTSAANSLGITCFNSDSMGPNCGALFVFALTDTVGITNHLIFSQTFNYKMDSAVPAVADVDPDHGTKRKVMFIGTWGGVLLAAWRHAGTFYTQTLDLKSLVTETITTTPVIRSAPLVWDFGEGPEIVFSWMPDHNAGGEARISAVKVRANMLNNTLIFTPTWTINREAWKSFPTLLPAANPPMVVIGWGSGVSPNPPSGQGDATSCGNVDWPLRGGLIALRVTGADSQRIAWEKYFTETIPYEGYRNFAVVADFNGDQRYDVVVANQCFGKLHSFDGLDGTEQWSYPLGPYLFSSPTVGDLAGDGHLEIVEGSLDGYVWVLDGGRRTYLPLIKR